MTPVRLATELGISDKTLRAYLRRRFPRHRGDHGSAWFLAADQVAAVRQHFGQNVTGEMPRAGALAPAAIAFPPPAVPSTTASIGPEPLRSYVRRGLDVLFVALNPPTQSATNGHWFSGTHSAFFKLLYRSGLITTEVPKATADELVFGGTQVNRKEARYGVTDLRPDLVQTNSGRVRLTMQHMADFIQAVRQNEPRIVCIIHQKVWTRFNQLVGRMEGVIDGVVVGEFTEPIARCPSRFICNYFPNGNSYPDAVKIEIFSKVRDAV